MARNFKINKYMLPTPFGEKEGFDMRGFYWSRVTTNSMEPTMDRGSLICFKPVSLEDVFPGSICVFVHYDKAKKTADRILGRLRNKVKGSDEVTIFFDNENIQDQKYKASDFDAVFKVMMICKEA